ncbi:hypothetical protein [Nocardioides mangrovi]|uniref:Septum formation-related domain-containing protein n=1 Tax=Nocardioides mangrovi TaxID=2874580 RepID=A0ABS7UJI4_9ACTN|nr:hypothetical protein [Nocardioides mangrovi]MBZ5741198.1 hypothetical protein [Nocardioides mangrovi]
MTALRRTAAALAAAVVLAPAAASAMPFPEPPAGRSGVHAQVQQVRDATAKYRSPHRAKRDGYALLKDAAGIACIDDPAGGMGVHLVDGDAVSDAKARAGHPEALVYEPTEQGKRLVAVEYVVFRSAWRKHHPTGKPHLFGRAFELQGADNRYGLPPFYELHLWAWKHNPSGLFDDWNPRVHCPPVA